MRQHGLCNNVFQLLLTEQTVLPCMYGALARLPGNEHPKSHLSQRMHVACFQALLGIHVSLSRTRSTRPVSKELLREWIPLLYISLLCKILRRRGRAGWQGAGQRGRRLLQGGHPTELLRLKQAAALWQRSIRLPSKL